MPIEPDLANEEMRLRLLRSLNLLHTPAEETFDRITRLAAELLQTPIALITLIDEHRQWFKSKVGLSISETPRDQAFCTYALEGNELLVVEDAQHDARFASNPLVTGAPNIRFYAGMPLHTLEGYVLGTLCVIDTQPRTLGDTKRAALKDLARMAELELAHQQTNRDVRVVHEQDRRALKRSESRFVAVFQHTPTGKALVDLNGRFTDVNSKLCEMTGYQAEELRQKTFSDITHPEDLAQGMNLFTDVLEGRREAYSFEKRYIRKDGQAFWVEINVTLVRDDEAKPLYFIGVILDISQRKESEALLRDYQSQLEQRVQERTQALNSSRETLQTITDNLPVLIAQVDGEMRYCFNNDVYRQIFGVDPKTLLGKPLTSMLRPDLYEELLPYFKQALAGDRVVCDNIRYSLEQDRIWSATYIPDWRNGEVVGFYVMSQDVTERKRAEKALIDKAMLDALTGLPNRRALQEKLEQVVLDAQVHQTPFAVFFLDLDGFKLVNDVHGHEGGDEILRQVARRITQTVRKDDFVSRLAGDEFVVIAHGVPSGSICCRIAENICDALSVPFMLDEAPAKLGTSIGIALSSSMTELSVEHLLAQADAAMYEAKRRGRNNYRFASGSSSPQEQTLIRLRDGRKD